MTGPLSQVITLTTFGNDYLLNGRMDENFLENLSFQFCNTIDFRTFESSFPSENKENIIAQDPNEWFQYLEESGCKKLRLNFRSSVNQTFGKDYQLAGFAGGGGKWLIEAVYPGDSNAWENQWKVTEPGNPQQKIWRVMYGQGYSNIPTVKTQICLQKSKEELKETLTAIEGFASEQKLESWAKQFEAAGAILNDSHPENSFYNPQLIPFENYSLTAKQIICAAGMAWVFGGMGSWNDLGFNTDEENQKYDSLSQTLYEKINQAIICATNSY